MCLKKSAIDPLNNSFCLTVVWGSDVYCDCPNGDWFSCPLRRSVGYYWPLTEGFFIRISWQIIPVIWFLSIIGRYPVFRMSSIGRFHCNYKINFCSLYSRIYPSDLSIYQNLVQKTFVLRLISKFIQWNNSKKSLM